MEFITKKPFYNSIRNFSPWLIHISKGLYVATVTPSNNIIIFHYVSAPRNQEDMRCKEVAKRNSSTIANTHPIDKLSAKYMLDTDKILRMQKLKN